MKIDHRQLKRAAEFVIDKYGLGINGRGMTAARLSLMKPSLSRSAIIAAFEISSAYFYRSRTVCIHGIPKLKDAVYSIEKTEAITKEVLSQCIEQAE
jgi:hypothetical protein